MIKQEIIHQNTISLGEKQEQPTPNLVITAKGSEYKYLPDGRTQRLQKAENRQYEPQEALVFVPDYQWVKANAPEDVLNFLGENETQYHQTLLSYVQGKGKRNYIVNSSGSRLEKNFDIRMSKGQIFLTFGDGEKVDFLIPVSKMPKVGFYTFDTRKYKEGDAYTREKHLGNKIISIIEK